MNIDNSATEQATAQINSEQKTVVQSEETLENLLTIEVAKNHPVIREHYEKMIKGRHLGALDNKIHRTMKESNLDLETVELIKNTTDSFEKIDLLTQAILSAKSGKKNEEKTEIEEKLRELQTSSVKAIEERDNFWKAQIAEKEREADQAHINSILSTKVSKFKLMGEMDFKTAKPVIEVNLKELDYMFVMGKNGLETRLLSNPEQLAIKDNKIVTPDEVLNLILNPFMVKSNSNPLPNGNPIVVTPNTGTPNKLLEHYKKVLG